MQDNKKSSTHSQLWLFVLPTLVIIVLTIALVCYNTATAPTKYPAIVTEYPASRATLNPYPELDGIMIDLYTADAKSLEILPGIGPEKASQIVDYITAHAPLSSLEQLLEVKGIGEATLEAIRPFVTLGHS